jgi:hypothetical protein
MWIVTVRGCSEQVVLTVVKFSPAAHTLGEFFEVVVNKTSTLDNLRDELAERDPDIVRFHTPSGPRVR